jgi:alpha-beta hydrolase superfamily lysophospholipase
VLCFKRGGADSFRVLFAASPRIGPSGIYHAERLHPFGWLRALLRILMWPLWRSPPKPPVEGVFSLPEAGGAWRDYEMDLGALGLLRFKARVSRWEVRPVDDGGFDLEHHTLRLRDGERAVVSCRPASERRGRTALLWLPGRVDTFYHDHVGRMLEAEGVDVFVLSYRRVGECMRQGHFKDPFLVSHTATGDFAEHAEEIALALDFIRTEGGSTVDHEYERVVGYAHSTGGAILVDYLISMGDAAFDGFIFNAPFLGWGREVGPILRFFITYMPSLLTRIGLWTCETTLTAAGGMNAWACQTYSQYSRMMDPTARPLYSVPVTAGFCRAVNRAHWRLRRRGSAGHPVTHKPFLVLASKDDDVLDGTEMLRAAHAIGPSRSLLELTYARHDVFASSDRETVDAAVAYLRAWLMAHDFLFAPSGAPSGA